MKTYNNLFRSASLTVTTTPQKLFDPPSPTRVGWRVVIPTSLGAGVGVRFLVRPPGGSAPTYSQLTNGPSIRAEAGAIVEDGATASLEVWVMVESGTVALIPEEILQ